MRNIIFETGKKVELKGKYFTLVKKINKNIWLSIEDKTDKIEMFTEDNLLNLYSSGKLRIVFHNTTMPSKKNFFYNNYDDINIEKIKHLEIKRAPLDLSISGKQSQLPNGQPWRTFCIDTFSGAIVSSLISFE